MKSFRRATVRPGLSSRDHHVRSWMAVGTAPSSKVIEMEWGTLIMTPPVQSGEPADIRFNFKNDVQSRRQAFEFVRVVREEITGRLAAQNVDARVEFVPASDHYHLLIVDRVAVEARAANGVIRAFSHGATSGREAPKRSISTTITGRHRVVEASK